MNIKKLFCLLVVAFAASIQSQELERIFEMLRQGHLLDLSKPEHREVLKLYIQMNFAEAARLGETAQKVDKLSMTLQRYPDLLKDRSLYDRGKINYLRPKYKKSSELTALIKSIIEIKNSLINLDPNSTFWKRAGIKESALEMLWELAYTDASGDGRADISSANDWLKDPKNHQSWFKALAKRVKKHDDFFAGKSQEGLLSIIAHTYALTFLNYEKSILGAKDGREQQSWLMRLVKDEAREFGVEVFGGEVDVAKLAPSDGYNFKEIINKVSSVQLQMDGAPTAEEITFRPLSVIEMAFLSQLGTHCSTLCYRGYGKYLEKIVQGYALTASDGTSRGQITVIFGTAVNPQTSKREKVAMVEEVDMVDKELLPLTLKVLQDAVGKKGYQLQIPVDLGTANYDAISNSESQILLVKELPEYANSKEVYTEFEPDHHSSRFGDQHEYTRIYKKLSLKKLATIQVPEDATVSVSTSVKPNLLVVNFQLIQRQIESYFTSEDPLVFQKAVDLLPEIKSHIWGDLKRKVSEIIISHFGNNLKVDQAILRLYDREDLEFNALFKTAKTKWENSQNRQGIDSLIDFSVVKLREESEQLEHLRTHNESYEGLTMHDVVLALLDASSIEFLLEAFLFPKAGQKASAWIKTLFNTLSPMRKAMLKSVISGSAITSRAMQDSQLRAKLLSSFEFDASITSVDALKNEAKQEIENYKNEKTIYELAVFKSPDATKNLESIYAQLEVTGGGAYSIVLFINIVSTAVRLGDINFVDSFFKKHGALAMKNLRYTFTSPPFDRWIKDAYESKSQEMVELVLKLIEQYAETEQKRDFDKILDKNFDDLLRTKNFKAIEAYLSRYKRNHTARDYQKLIYDAAHAIGELGDVELFQFMLSHGMDVSFELEARYRMSTLSRMIVRAVQYNQYDFLYYLTQIPHPPKINLPLLFVRAILDANSLEYLFAFMSWGMDVKNAFEKESKRFDLTPEFCAELEALGFNVNGSRNEALHNAIYRSNKILFDAHLYSGMKVTPDNAQNILDLYNRLKGYRDSQFTLEPEVIAFLQKVAASKRAQTYRPGVVPPPKRTGPENYSSGPVAGFLRFGDLVLELIPEGLRKSIEALPERLQAWVKAGIGKYVEGVLAKVRAGESGVQSNLRELVLRIVRPDGTVDRGTLTPADTQALSALAAEGAKETIEGPMGDGQENRQREWDIKEFRERFKNGLEEGLSGKKLAEQQVEFLLAVWIMDVVKLISKGKSVGDSMREAMLSVLSYDHLEGLAGFVGASTAMNALGMVALRQAIQKDVVAEAMMRPAIQKAFMKVLGSTSLMAGVSVQQVISKVQGLKAIQELSVQKYDWMRAYAKLDKEGLGRTPGSVAALFALSKEGGRGALLELEPADLRRLMTGFNPNYAEDKLTRTDGSTNYAFLQKLKLQVMNPKDRQLSGLRRFDLREAVVTTTVVLVSSAAARFMTGGMPVVSSILTIALAGAIQAEIQANAMRIESNADLNAWEQNQIREGNRLATLLNGLSMPLKLSEKYIAESLEPVIEESEIVWMEMEREQVVRGYAVQKAYAKLSRYLQETLGKRIQSELYTMTGQAREDAEVKLKAAVDMVSLHLEGLVRNWESGAQMCHDKEISYLSHEYLKNQYDDHLRELECSIAAFRNQKWRIENRVKRKGSLKDKLEKILALDEETGGPSNNALRLRVPLQAMVQDQYMRLEQAGNQYRDLSMGIKAQMRAYRVTGVMQAAIRSAEPNTPGGGIKNQNMIVSRFGETTYIDMRVPPNLKSQKYGLKVVVYGQDGQPIHQQTIRNKVVTENGADESLDPRDKKYFLKFRLSSPKLRPGQTYWLKTYSLEPSGALNKKHDFEINTQIRIPFEEESRN